MKSHSNYNEGFRIQEEFVCQAIPDPSVLACICLKTEIEWPEVNPHDLLNDLRRLLPEAHRDLVSLSVDSNGVNPGIVVAMIQGGHTVFASFLTALLTRALSSNPPQFIVTLEITTIPGGTTHELPLEASPAQIEQMVSVVTNAQKIRMRIKVG